ncbi:MAG: SDR family oxidoreductase [Verrucomicrobiales bacterium]|nr:SDR family oxidoreductase [Verrucomicrobiales bacterium]
MPGRTVWVTGAAGLIGTELVRQAAASVPGWRVLGLTRADLDLTHSAAVTARFRSEPPDWILHCAGLTKSPQCQVEPELAWTLNVEVTRQLSELAASARLLFFSTDLVFDGRAGGYREADAVNPLNRYGETKAVAERVVLDGPRHLVVRTSLNYGSSRTGDRTFNEETVRLWRERRPMTLFTDEYRCPIPAVSTARAVWDLVTAVERGDARLPEPGADPTRRLFHVAGAEKLSRWELGRALAERWPELQPELRPGSLKDYVGGPRPADTSLVCDRVQAVLDWSLPRFSEWLRAQPREPEREGG